jgi:hypothetical protein
VLKCAEENGTVPLYPAATGTLRNQNYVIREDVRGVWPHPSHILKRSPQIYNIKMDRQEVVCGGVDWIDLDQDRERWRTLVTYKNTHTHPHIRLEVEYTIKWF